MGKLLLRLINVSSKSVGMVTLFSNERLGMLNDGMEMLPNGLILLTAETADWMAELADAMSL